MGCLIVLGALSACKYLATDTASETQNLETSTRLPQEDVSYKAVIVKHLAAALREQNHVKAYRYISTKDQAYKSRDEYVHENKGPKIAPAILKTFSFKVIDAQVREESVRAEVELTHPDMQVLNQEILKQAKAQKLLNKPEALDAFVEQEMLRRLPTLPMTNTYRIMDLVKEGDEWRIYYNWAKKIEEKAKRVHLKLGETGPLASDPDLGHVNLTVNHIRYVQASQFPPPPKKKPWKPNQVFAMVDLTLTNHGREPFSQASVFRLVNPSIKDQQGKTYPMYVDYIQAFGDTPFQDQFNDMPNLEPKASNRGEIMFVIDAQAKDMTLNFDAGFNLKHGKKYIPGKRLIYHFKR